MTMRALTAMMGLCLLQSGLHAQPTPNLVPTRVEYNRDIRPILAENCFACHGLDAAKRMGKLRLDQFEGATAPAASGKRAVVAGAPLSSELLRRVSQAGALHMPPATTGKKLTAAQILTLRSWVAQGAKYQSHWAYLPIVSPKLPPAPKTSSPSWPIDGFILAKQAAAGVEPSPQADRRTLLRRLSFDLIGLPPTPAEVAEFLADKSPSAYQKQVDRLLASPHYGERMALYWLDLVRYADTDGYHGDRNRSVTPFRDYVINAFNQNMPFNRFTTEQLAGDLVDKPTIEQKIASGYNRLNMVSREGGAQDREYLAKYASERVRTTSQVWMGSTLGCAECHDHKYDPFTTKDFYRFAAYFADIQQVGLYQNEREDLDPILKMPTAKQAAETALLDERIKAATAAYSAATPALAAAQLVWEGKPDAKTPEAVTKALAVAPEFRTPDQKKAISAHWRSVAPELATVRAELDAAKKSLAALDKDISRMMITVSVKPLTMRVLPRGNWMDESGEVVQPGVPHFLPQPRTELGAGRLALAKWLVSKENPLTSRVMVNRFWMLLFGSGLARSPGDLGAQGSWPTHPELLDWLAMQFEKSGWDIKHMMKLICMSNTYRQTSSVIPANRERDPFNMLFARQSSYRLEAEGVRDNALAISGLLSRKVGGISVRPYQPAGYYDHCNTFAEPATWIPSAGEDQYRRGLYTHWKRSFLHPSLLAFDAPSREECTVERPRSNTPLQALVLMNDPTYVEAARVLAEEMMRAGDISPAGRIAIAFERALSRPPSAAEVRVLGAVYKKHRADFAQDAASAENLISVGQKPPASDLDKTDLAAWTSVARVILNLHETVTRE